MDGVVIVAAGRGERLGRSTPKALVPLAGRALLLHSLQTFLTLPELQVVVVAPPDHLQAVSALLPSGVQAIPGGATRQESVRLGVLALPAQTQSVLVHDAARPLLPAAIASALRSAIAKHGAAATVLSLRDTLHRLAQDDRLSPGVAREGFVRAQTPQGAGRALLLATLDQARRESRVFTDEASLLMAYGHGVVAVQGCEQNFKITTPEDLQLAESLLRAPAASALDP